MTVNWYDLNYDIIRKNYYEINCYRDIRKKDNKKIVPTFISNRGYKRISLIIEEKSKAKKYSIHRLVASTFIIVKEKHQNIVNHKDCNKQNNYYKNLEWSTQSENNLHAYDNNLATTKNQNHHFSVYSDDFIHRECHLLEKKMTIYDIIKELKIIDLNMYSRSSKEYQRIRFIIKSIRGKKCHRDIVLKYNF
jgi:hypothetical protein